MKKPQITIIKKLKINNFYIYLLYDYVIFKIQRKKLRLAQS